MFFKTAVNLETLSAMTADLAVKYTTILIRRMDDSFALIDMPNNLQIAYMFIVNYLFITVKMADLKEFDPKIIISKMSTNSWKVYQVLCEKSGVEEIEKKEFEKMIEGTSKKCLKGSAKITLTVRGQFAAYCTDLFNSLEDEKSLEWLEWEGYFGDIDKVLNELVRKLKFKT